MYLSSFSFCLASLSLVDQRLSIISVSCCVIGGPVSSSWEKSWEIYFNRSCCSRRASVFPVVAESARFRALCRSLSTSVLESSFTSSSTSSSSVFFRFSDTTLVSVSLSFSSCRDSFNDRSMATIELAIVVKDVLRLCRMFESDSSLSDTLWGLNRWVYRPLWGLNRWVLQMFSGFMLPSL